MDAYFGLLEENKCMIQLNTDLYISESYQIFSAATADLISPLCLVLGFLFGVSVKNVYRQKNVYQSMTIQMVH